MDRPRGWSWRHGAVLLGLGLLVYAARSILPTFAVAGLLAYVLHPAVAWLAHRLPRPVAALLVLLPVVAGPIGLVVALGPTVLRETSALVARSPALLAAGFVQVTGHDTVTVLGQRVTAAAFASQVGDRLVATLGRSDLPLLLTRDLAAAVLEGVVVLATVAYLLIDPGQLRGLVFAVIPPAAHGPLRRIGGELNDTLRRFLIGQAGLVVLMATVTWVGLGLGLHVPYALPLALATGVLEVVPFFGPVTAGALAVAVGLAHGGTAQGLQIVVLYTVLRQLEDQIAMPFVMRRATHIPPVVTIAATLAGGAIAGPLGMLFAVPTVILLGVVGRALLAGDPGEAPSAPTVTAASSGDIPS